MKDKCIYTYNIQIYIIILCFVRNGLDYEYLEEFPLKMVHRLPEMTGRSGSQYIIISMEYGKHFSGEIKKKIFGK